MADEEVKPKKSFGGGCGAKDLQNTDGKDNVCVLESGHAGDHTTSKVSGEGYSFSEMAVTEALPASVAAKIKVRDDKAVKAVKQ